MILSLIYLLICYFCNFNVSIYFWFLVFGFFSFTSVNPKKPWSSLDGGVPLSVVTCSRVF